MTTPVRPNECTCLKYNSFCEKLEKAWDDGNIKLSFSWICVNLTGKACDFNVFGKGQCVAFQLHRISQFEAAIAQNSQATFLIKYWNWETHAWIFSSMYLWTLIKDF